MREKLLYVVSAIVVVWALFLPGRRTEVLQAQTGAEWTEFHAPAANTQATITHAAVVGKAHVADCVIAAFVAGATAPVAATVNVVVRDGAAGSGTIKFQRPLSITAVAGDPGVPMEACGLSIVGTAGNAMTVEFTAAGGANTIESVFIRGYDR